MENKSLYSPKNIEETPLEREILVHGAMHYKCKDCGRVFRMWLEKGLEDKIQDAEYPGKHKPVPFTIGCLCGGLMEHVSWHNDVHLDSYSPIDDTMDFFENVNDVDHGVSHLRTDGFSTFSRTYTDLSKLTEAARALVVGFDEPMKTVTKEEKPRKSGLEMYSTTQLKEELRRRKRW